MSDNQPPEGSAGSSEPGWHADPWQQHALRWWDGTQWTDQVHDQGAMAGAQTAASSAMQSISSADERSMAKAAHLLTLVGFLIPLVNIIAPLVVWQTKGKESPLVEQHAKESLNFQISMTIYYTVAGFLIIVLIGLLLLPALIILDIIFVVQQTQKVDRNEASRYPMCIRLIS